MIDVLIPAKDSAHADGVAYADAPNTSEYELLDGLPENLPVHVVPPEALQALLELNPRFAKYEKRFGKMPNSYLTPVLALFSLIEEERTFDQSQRRAYEDWKLAQRRAERTEKVKRGPEESEQMARALFQHDKASLDSRGRLRAITDELNVGSVLRVWWDKRKDTLSPGILVDGFQEALRVLLLLNLGNSDSAANCAWCHKRFSRSKVAQLFCSLRCGNNARQARLRAKKGGKHGSRQTR